MVNAGTESEMKAHRPGNLGVTYYMIVKGLEMGRQTSLILIISLFTLFATRIQAQHEEDSGAKKKFGPIEITLNKLEINDKNLELRYQIRNRSGHDIWICDDIDTNSYYGWKFEVFLIEDGRTLLVRRRHNVPFQVFAELPIGRYVRLCPGEEWTESLSLSVPVHLRSVFWGRQKVQGTEYARSLALEIGFYAENLPGMVRGILTKAENMSDRRLDEYLAIIKYHFGGLLYFNELNENLNTNEQVLIPYSHQTLKGEQVLRISVNGLRIPYKEEECPELSPPDLSRCTRVEIQYQPSMLDYFFPYAAKRSLLSPKETQCLRSIRTIVVHDQECILAFAHDVSKGSRGGIVTERNMAHVVCYHDGELLKSFTVYNNESIVTDGKRFMYPEGLPSLKRLTLQIKPYELRAECAHNLRVLWTRLNSYHMIEKIKMAYPASTEWCDAIVRAYGTRTMNDEYIRGPFKCPSVGKGKCHYAMNPNCKPDSPPDMILLFETKAGWNQHGGPELFTFDNHDPKGGCVLLNNGTVKFIRTTEELKQLRWK